MSNKLLENVELDKTPNKCSVPADLATINFKELTEEMKLLDELAQKSFKDGDHRQSSLLQRLLDKLDELKVQACLTLPLDVVYDLPK